MSITVRAAAKINLHLGVGAPRDDGFHPLSTVYQAVGLCDDLTVSETIEPGAWELALTASDWVDAGGVPADSHNIVYRAAVALALHHDRAVSGRVVIDKAIPVAGGLAGGSADAAAALVALDRLWGVHTSDDDLLGIAGELGSDVPFALVGGTALGSGRGEIVVPLVDAGTWWWVLVPSLEGLSTPEVYRRFDALHPDASPTPTPADDVIAAVVAGEPLQLARALHNDLQEAAVDLRPDLGELITRGESEGALRGIISGSGPTCAFLCESPEEARAVAGSLQSPDLPTVLVVNGAVAGAHVVR